VASCHAGDGTGLWADGEGRAERIRRDRGGRKFGRQFRGKADDGEEAQGLGEKGFAGVVLAHRWVVETG